LRRARGRRLGVVPIARSAMRAADQQLAGRIGLGYRSALGIDQAHLHIEQRIPHGPRLAAYLLGRQPEVVGPSLGEAVAGLEVHSALPETLEYRLRTRGAAAD